MLNCLDWNGIDLHAWLHAVITNRFFQILSSNINFFLTERAAFMYSNNLIENRELLGFKNITKYHCDLIQSFVSMAVSNNKK